MPSLAALSHFAAFVAFVSVSSPSGSAGVLAVGFLSVGFLSPLSPGERCRPVSNVAADSVLGLGSCNPRSASPKHPAGPEECGNHPDRLKIVMHSSTSNLPNMRSKR
eukprot:SAG31_NODE_1864_length_7036_cov_3.477584_3_plen_107_part_00